MKEEEEKEKEEEKEEEEKEEKECHYITLSKVELHLKLESHSSPV